MAGAYLRQLFTDTPMTLVGLLIFFTCFSALTLWVFARKGARREYEALGQIPLETE